MITVDAAKCNQCKICIKHFKGYCISEKDGLPQFDPSICNICQKCVALCPSQAILVNGNAPRKITGPLAIKPEDLLELLARRRSAKVFEEKELADELIARIVAAGKYAPNQNKNIDAIIIKDKDIIDIIDRRAFQFINRLYQFLFSFWPLTKFFSLFSSQLPAIRKKMEYSMYEERCVVKKGTQALVLLIGNKRVPVTAASAHYLLATMTIYAEALGVGSCLMDSLKLTIDYNQELRKQLSIPKGSSVLGVLSLGYSAEKIANVPQGYELKILKTV